MDIVNIYTRGILVSLGFGMQNVLGFDNALIAPLVLIVGFAVGFIMYNEFKVQVGGVIATPLLVLYVLRSPLSLIIFAVSAGLSYAVIRVLVNFTLMYGRRLFYLAAIVSITTTYMMLGLLSVPSPAYFSIIPAIIGYNLYRETESVERVSRSILIWLIEFAIIYAIAYTLYSIGGGLA